VNYKLPKEVLEIAEGIRSMKIRGAGRIARAAVKALKIAALGYRGSNVKDFYDYMMYASKLLLATRPTAVSLPNAVAYVMSRLSRNIEAFAEAIFEARGEEHATIEAIMANIVKFKMGSCRKYDICK